METYGFSIYYKAFTVLRSLKSKTQLIRKTTIRITVMLQAIRHGAYKTNYENGEKQQSIR